MSKAMMYAIRYYQFGGPEVLQMERVPRPEPQAGEVLVKVHATGVLPIDWKIRQGIVPFPVRFPMIPGSSFAGTITEIGKGVSEFQPGQRVLGRSKHGTYAGYTTVFPEQIAVIPESVSFGEASTISGGATTAWQALLHDAGLTTGQRVLIHGAAGGVGSFAVQIAKWKGAYVTSTVGPDNVDFVCGLDSDEVIDYTSTSFEAVVHDMDIVLDTVGGDIGKQSLSVLKSGGTLISLAGQPPSIPVTRPDIRVIRPSRLSNNEDLKNIIDLMERGVLKAIVGKSFPLHEVAKAHALSQTGHGSGRIVLQINHR